MNTYDVKRLTFKDSSDDDNGYDRSVLEMTQPDQEEQIQEANVSVSNRIRAAILQGISDGTYLPGERLKELAIAREFKASQGSVREAFRSLESLGVLVSGRYQGTRVRAISERETEEVYQLRGYLEEIACQLIPASCLERNIGEIDALQIEMRGAALAGDIEGFAQANIRFHRSIVGLAANQAFLKVWDSLEIAMRSRLNIQKNEQRLHALAEIHQPIVDALKLGDQRRAGMLLKEHSFSFLQHVP